MCHSVSDVHPRRALRLRVDCSGTALNWGRCYEKAGDLCGSTGYDIVAQTGDQGGMVKAASTISLACQSSAEISSLPVNNKIDARTFGKEVSLSRERDIADIVRYQAQRLSDGVTKRTINHELQVLRMAINLAYENGHLREQPIRKWRFVLGADSPRTRVLRPDEEGGSTSYWTDKCRPLSLWRCRRE